MNIDKLQLLAKTIRMLSADGVQAANSGHPGLPMGAADYSAVLWANYMRFNPGAPDWANRDRFVLSAGHGSMLAYSLLHLFGYDLSLDELRNFRQWESKTPGHPEFGETPGVETTTGPLGQGFGNGVGLALSGKLLAERYSKELFNYRVFGIVSDGDLMEGIAAEAASLAGHLALDNLIYFYDDNEISIGGSTDICFTENVAERFNSYNWFVQEVDGHDLEACAKCLEYALAEPSRPSIICARTTIGLGSPNKANTAGIHGAPLGEDELALTKEGLGWPTDQPFYIPEEVASFCGELIESKLGEFETWQGAFGDWVEGNPELADQYRQQAAREVPAELKTDLLEAFKDQKKDATRNLSGQAIQVMAKHLPGLVGGSADLEPSTKTLIKDAADIQSDNFSGRNIRFGVREHAMGAMVNGLAYTGSWFPYSATFLVFSDYMRPSIRLAALSKLQSLFIFTHDSFWVGEDGPTHQPIEHTASLRLIPNLYVFRPADGVEIAYTYLSALELKESPSALLFTRQGLSPLEREEGCDLDDIAKGAYVVQGSDSSDLVLVATGSEVEAACGAAELLSKQGVSARVVSMPCKEIFLEQDESYQQQVIPATAKRVSIEAGVTSGWEDIVGDSGLMIGKDGYGASAPGGLLAEKFGFTSDAIAQRISEWL